MPLPISKDKGGAVSYVIKRIKGSDSYDKMKEHNEYGMGERMVKQTSPEKDMTSGIDHSISQILDAFERKDSSSLKSSLVNLVNMLIDQKEQEEDWMESEND